jgi:hypothetical protein
MHSAFTIHQNLQQPKIDDRFLWAERDVSFSMLSAHIPTGINEIKYLSIILI